MINRMARTKVAGKYSEYGEYGVTILIKTNVHHKSYL